MITRFVDDFLSITTHFIDDFLSIFTHFVDDFWVFCHILRMMEAFNCIIEIICVYLQRCL